MYDLPSVLLGMALALPVYRFLDVVVIPYLERRLGGRRGGL